MDGTGNEVELLGTWVQHSLNARAEQLRPEKKKTEKERRRNLNSVPHSPSKKHALESYKTQINVKDYFIFLILNIPSDIRRIM